MSVARDSTWTPSTRHRRANRISRRGPRATSVTMWLVTRVTRICLGVLPLLVAVVAALWLVSRYELSHRGPRVPASADEPPRRAPRGAQLVPIGAIHVERAARGVCINPDGRTVAFADGSEAIGLLDLNSHVVRRHALAAKLVSLAWSPDGGRVAACGSDVIVLWNVRGGSVDRDMRQHLVGTRTSCGALAFGASGRQLFVGAAHQTVDVWDLSSGSTSEPRTLLGEGGLEEEWQGPIVSSPVGGSETRCIAVGPDERWLAAGDGTYPLRILDARSGRLMRMLHGHGRALLSVAISPDGKMMVSSSVDTTTVWRADQWSVVTSLGSSGYVGWTKDSLRVVIAALRSRALEVWDATSGAACVGVDLDSSPMSLAVGENVIVVGCSDATIRWYKYHP